MIEFLLLLPVALAFFYLMIKVDEWQEESRFLIEKAKHMENGEDWDQREF